MRTPSEYVHKDGTKTYKVKFRSAGRYTSETFHRKSDALTFAAMLDAGGPQAAYVWLRAQETMVDEMTFAQWFTSYVDTLTGITPRTRADYHALHRRYLAVLDDLPLSLVSKTHVAGIVNDMHGREPPLSSKTIKNAVYLLSSVMGEAVEEGHIGRSPVRKIRLPAPEAHDDLVRFLTADEAGRLVEATPKTYQAFVTFLLGSGLRWAEATALQGRHVNLDAGTVHVHQAWKRIPGGQEIGPPKSRKARRTVNVSTLGLLAAASVMRGESDWVFVGTQGKPLRHGNFYNRVWKPACERAGLDPRPRIHDTRHTFASWLISEGATLEQVQDQLGHESHETTRRIYAHLLPAVGVEAGRLASAAMQRALGDRVQFPPLPTLPAAQARGVDEREDAEHVAADL